jgi:GNAT superfamily N-acetyltransferase
VTRDACSDDFETIMRLYRQLQPGDPVLSDGSDRKVFESILESSWLHLVVLEHEGQVIATAYLNVTPNMTRSASPYAVIENVVVDSGFRGRGFGKTLMAAVLGRAWDAGCYKATLTTGSQREATHAFYRACGFTADDKSAYVARPLPHSSHPKVQR